MSVSRKVSGASGPPGSGVAKVFMHGRSQAVRLPKEFRLQGTEVRVRRVHNGVILEDKPFDIDAWFARIDAIPGDFPDAPEQPPMPLDEDDKYSLE